MKQINYGDFYQYWHPETSSHFDSMTKAYTGVLKKYLPSSITTESALELGCGRGYCMAALKNFGFNRVVGVDLDKSQIDSCKERNLDVIMKDAIDFLSSSTESFNLILAMDMLEHLDKNEVTKLLDLIYQRLSPGGVFVCQVPNCYSVAGNAYRYIDWTHNFSFSFYSLKFLVASAGFDLVEVLGMNDSSRPPVYRLRKFYDWLKKELAKRLWRFLLSAEIPIDTNVPMSANMICIAIK